MKYNCASIKRMKDGPLKSEAILQYLEKRFHKTKPKVIKSLQEDTRLHCSDELGTDWIEYGFFEAKDWTDEEIQEFVDDMEIHINSPYDCTGMVFTQWITWHRNPCGLVSVIHKKGLDV